MAKVYKLLLCPEIHRDLNLSRFQYKNFLSLELFMREYMQRDSAAQNGSKTSCKREAYHIKTKRFHTEPFQSPV